MIPKRLCLLSATLIAGACVDAVEPVNDDVRPHTPQIIGFPPHILRWNADASPPVLVLKGARPASDLAATPGDGGVLTVVLERYQASFWVFNDQEFSLELRYATGHRDDDDGEDDDVGSNGNGNQGNNGPKGNHTFVKLEVPAGSLYQWPDGRRFGSRDSVEVTVRADSTQLLVRFEPGGLRFVPACPVLLQIFYGQVRGDFNGDGVVNGADHRLGRQLRLWHQSRPAGVWEKYPAEHSLKGKWFKAPICGFSGFAISF